MSLTLMAWERDRVLKLRYREYLYLLLGAGQPQPVAAELHAHTAIYRQSVESTVGHLTALRWQTGPDYTRLLHHVLFD